MYSANTAHSGDDTTLDCFANLLELADQWGYLLECYTADAVWYLQHGTDQQVQDAQAWMTRARDNWVRLNQLAGRYL